MPEPEPLRKTFDVLACSTAPQAVDVLVYALDLKDALVRSLALETLLKRHTPRGHVEAIRRLDALSPDLRRKLQDACLDLGSAIKHALNYGDPALRRNTLALLRDAEGFEYLPLVIEGLQDVEGETYPDTLATVQHLVERLYCLLDGQEASSIADDHTRRAELEKIRNQVLEHLQAACERAPTHPDLARLIEALLILGAKNHEAVKFILWHSEPACRRLAGDVLLTSRHPGVMQLVLDFMGQNYPHPKVFEALSHRDDPEFIRHLLAWFPRQLTRVQASNFRQLDHIRWLEDAHRVPLEQIPGELHGALVALIRATGLPPDTRLRLLEWILRYGSAGGREAASDVLLQLSEETAQDIILAALAHPDPEVQAWATRQLRRLGVANSLEVLVELLDSPVQAVREAARRELDDFDLHRILELFEQWDSESCRRAGQLILKIDPHAIDRLRQELAHSVQWRRIRAAHAAQALELHSHVIDDLIDMLGDPAALVRRTAVDVLASVRSEKVVRALKNLVNDPSPRVREAVARAMRHLAEMQTQPAPAP